MYSETIVRLAYKCVAINGVYLGMLSNSEELFAVKKNFNRFQLLSVSILLYALLLASPQLALAGPLNVDGSGGEDLAVFRGGSFFVADGSKINETGCGTPAGLPVPGNYLSNIVGRVANFNPSFGLWQICSSGTTVNQSWGLPGDLPVPGDYNGDGITDYGVFRPGTGEWFVLNNTGGLNLGTTQVMQFGLPGDIPVPADYDGDGTDDLGVFRRDPVSGGTAWFLNLSGGGSQTVSFGLIGDVPVAADYDGNGTDDVAVWRPSTGVWFIQQGNTISQQQFGLPGDVPSPIDTNGDNSADFVVYRPGTGQWFSLPSGQTTVSVVSVGTTGDRVANHSRSAATDQSAPLDINGDRISDLAVLRRSSSGNLGFLFASGTPDTHSNPIVELGSPGDRVVSGDFDGDGQSELAAVSSDGQFLQWKFLRSSDQGAGRRELVVNYGLDGDQLLPADYDGDGITDLGVVRNLADGQKLWIPNPSSIATLAPVLWGFSTDRAFTADVDGDRKSDLIVVRVVDNDLVWFIRTATGVALTPRAFGLLGDITFVGDYSGDGKAQLGVIRRIEGGGLVIIEGMAPFFWGLSGDVVLGGRYGPENVLLRAVWRIVDGQGFFFIRRRDGTAAVKPFGVAGDLPLGPLRVTETSAGGSSGGTTTGGPTTTTPEGGSGARLNCASRSQVTQQESGFVWKPISEGDGNLVVLFGASRAGQILRAALVEERVGGAVVLETLRFVGNTNGGRPTFRASRPGRNYPSNVVLVRQDQQSRINCIVVPNPGSRTG